VASRHSSAKMNGLLEEAFRGFDAPALFGRGQNLTAANWPKIEVNETDAEMKVLAELPGLDEKDIDLSISDGALIIRGEKKAEVEDKSRQFSERFYGRFERRIPLGVDEEDKVEASFKNGVLTVTLPKIARAADERQAARMTDPRDEIQTNGRADPIQGHMARRSASIASDSPSESLSSRPRRSLRPGSAPADPSMRQRVRRRPMEISRVPNNPDQTPQLGLTVKGASAFDSNILNENQTENIQFGVISLQKYLDAADVQIRLSHATAI
jgi:HSP20 family protein